MLDRLRWHISAVYVLAGFVFLALMGGGTYALLSRYFQETTDWALQRRLATQLRLWGAFVPAGLNAPPLTVLAPVSQRKNDDDHADDHAPAFDSELAAVYLAAFNAQGELAPLPGLTTEVLIYLAEQPAPGAWQWRTLDLAGQGPTRLLTYALPTEPVIYVQVGRPLNDQLTLLNQMVLGLMALGAVLLMAVSGLGWWLAGRALAPAQAAWTRQQAFVANASHELRAPLTLMRASAEVAQRQPDAPHTPTLLADIIQECDHMARLVDDLLLLSRLDAQQIKLTVTAAPLEPLLADLTRQVGRVAEQYGVRVVCAGVAGAARADSARLRQMLLIVLDNAVQFTPPGGQVTVSARAHGSQVSITIRDTGPGIAPEHLPFVFERFYRVDSSRQGRPGSGLGLSIARALAQAHHGTVTLDSAPGRGTTVTFTLPAAP